MENTLMTTMLRRRSVRQFTGEPVPEEKLDAILQAGMLGPSGHNKRAYEFLVLRDPETVHSLSECRTSGTSMLMQAETLIIVLGKNDLSDTWIEDCSVALTQMHLMAGSLGIGSCWVQVRGRKNAAGEDSGEVIRRRFGIPDTCTPEAMLCLGIPAAAPEPHTPEELPSGKIHRDRF